MLQDEVFKHADTITGVLSVIGGSDNDKLSILSVALAKIAAQVSPDADNVPYETREGLAALEREALINITAATSVSFDVIKAFFAFSRVRLDAYLAARRE